MLKVVSIIAVGLLVAGCSTKDASAGPKYNVDVIKKSDGYIINLYNIHLLN